MHDFQAERPDELDANAGDNITVVAQSNYEWFVAKPIGRLGRPGLIPVSFVEIKDPASGNSIPDSDVTTLMKSGEIPRVEDWKRAMIAYKAASIPLGVLDDTTVTPVPNSPFTPNYGNQNDYPPSSQSDRQTYDTRPQLYPDEDNQVVYEPLPFGGLVKARIESFHFENGDYWFRISATWQPRDPDTLNPTEAPGRLTIFRVYEDFYNFQIRILDAFPYEAGRSDDPNSETGISTRILPYMPGPVDQVDNIVSSLRQEELDQYLQQLTLLEQIEADYILRHDLVREFFTPKAGDLQFRSGEDSSNVQPVYDTQDGVSSAMQSLSLEPGTQRRSYRTGSSDGSHYDAVPPLSRDNSRNGSNGYAERSGSSASRPFNAGDISPQSKVFSHVLVRQLIIF
jgi:bud emergence protein 1